MIVEFTPIRPIKLFVKLPIRQPPYMETFSVAVNLFATH